MTPAGRSVGEAPDTLFHNLELFNPFTCSWEDTSFTVKDGYVVGMDGAHTSSRVDLGGARVVPGLIDAHVHIESSLLTPSEFGRLVLKHGTTTVIADPHEIANILGREGIRYLHAQAQETPLDVLFLLPSCVPASEFDCGGAVLSANDLFSLQSEIPFLGLGEVMDVVGVLAGKDEVIQKLGLSSIIDGHAPLLRGLALDRYIAAGVQSDHECTGAEEAQEKLRKGMFIMVREGSTERNLAALIGCVTPCSISRWSFATDDRHATMLAEHGHIDDCIRKAVEFGLEEELALRMATLSPCDRFHLTDRGAIAPGRCADFCVLSSTHQFHVDRVFKKGKDVTNLPYTQPAILPHRLRSSIPHARDIEIHGTGGGRVIGLCEHQIITRSMHCEIEGARVPDIRDDILKVVVCSRYTPGRIGVGLVHGFGITHGAIATSVAHDSHNLVAVGTGDDDLRRALGCVIQMGGGMVALRGGESTTLPLECAGLMSAARYEDVVDRLIHLERYTLDMGAIKHPFMYLSFLTLTVIPHLRITDQGLFDVDAGKLVPLFYENSQ